MSGPDWRRELHRSSAKHGEKTFAESSMLLLLSPRS
jgi:hypothetical protein